MKHVYKDKKESHKIAKKGKVLCFRKLSEETFCFLLGLGPKGRQSAGKQN